MNHNEKENQSKNHNSSVPRSIILLYIEMSPHAIAINNTEKTEVKDVSVKTPSRSLSLLNV